MNQNKRRQHTVRLATNDDHYQTVKITAVKKLVWNEIEFVHGIEAVELVSSVISQAFFENGLIAKDEKISLGKYFSNLAYWDGHEETADKLCNVLAEVSKKTDLGFIVNYCCWEDFMGNGLFLPLGELHFHPELIMYGKRLINDYPDIRMNRTYFDITHGLLIDCGTRDKTLLNELYAHGEGLDYWTKFSDEELMEKGLVLYEDAEQRVCNEMLDSLKKHFQVDYSVDVIYGNTKQDYEGLCDDVRRQILERF